MASVQEMKATVRPKGGKGAARNARRSGRVPGVIYGNNEPPMMVLIEHDELKKRIYQGRFLTTLYELEVDGKKHRVIPRDFQLDALKDLPMHVDFLRVAEGATIRVHIPVHVLNTDQSPGVKRGGAVNIVTHSVEVGCPADAIPESIDVDIAGAGDQPLQASQRCDAAAGRARDRARGHDAGHRGAAVGLRRRAEGRRRSGCRRRCCCCCACRRRCRCCCAWRCSRCCAGCRCCCRRARGREEVRRPRQAPLPHLRLLGRRAAATPLTPCCSSSASAIPARATPATATTSGSWRCRRSRAATTSRPGAASFRAWRWRA